MGGGPSEEEQRAARQRAEAEEQAKRDADFDRRLSKVRGEREADLARGRARGEELFGEGKLGRVREGRSADIADVIERRRARLSGFSPEEQEAFKSAAVQPLQRNAQNVERDIRRTAGASGLRGGIVAAQQMQAKRDAAREMSNAERDLFLKNIAEKKEGLSAFEGSVGSAEADELKRQEANLQRKSQEAFGRTSTEMGFAGLGANDRAAIMQGMVGEQQAKAMRASANSGGGGKGGGKI